MKNPGESHAGGSEPNFDANNTAQAPERPRGFFGRIGKKISGVIRDKHALAAVDKINLLSKSDKDEDKEKLKQLGDDLMNSDLIDDRVADAILNTFDNFDSGRLNLFLEKGVAFETIFKNIHTRELALSRFKSIVLHYGGNSPDDLDNWFLNGYSYDDKFLQPIIKDVLADENVRDRVVDSLSHWRWQSGGDKNVAVCGDRCIRDALKRLEKIPDDIDKIEAIKGRFDLLKILGYDYFSDREGDRKEKISDLLGNSDGCLFLDRLGFMDKSIVSAMYRIKAQRLKDYVWHGIHGIHDPSYSSPSHYEREHLEKSYSIPEWLEPEDGDELAAYWKEQDEKCGFDAMAYIAYLNTCCNYWKKYNATGLDLFSSQRTFDEKYFEESQVGTPLGFLKDISVTYRFARDNDTGFDSDLLTFFSANSEKIKDPYARGLIENWKKIQYDDPKETDEARRSYLDYVTRTFKLCQIKNNNEAKDTLLFDENRNPTDAFYSNDEIFFRGAKKFLPFIDKNWKARFTDNELAALDFTEDYSDFNFREIFTGRYAHTDGFLSLLKEHLNECKGIATFCKTLTNFDDGFRRAITKNIDCFDENGLKYESIPIFMRSCLSSGDLSPLVVFDDDTIEQAGLDGVSKQLALTFRKSEINFPLDSSNIVTALSRFLYYDADDWSGASENDLKIREAFSDIATKDLALESLRKNYEEYLGSEMGTEFPIGLSALSGFMHENNGAGPLVQIEAFLDFVGVLDSAGEKGKELTLKIEERMKKDHWDNQEKKDFYAISAEIIQASPEIYNEFAELFTNIKDKKDFETFTKEIYPLYRAKLALLRNYEEHSDGIGHGKTEVNFDNVDKEALLNQLHIALLPFNLQELSPDKRQEGIGRVRKIILDEITGLFREKLGIRPEAIPSDFTKGDVRVIQDMTLYLSNFSDPTALDKNLIGLFLALNIGNSGGWDELRRGAEIDPAKYLDLSPEEMDALSKALRTSRQNNPINKEYTGIYDDERLVEFRSALQEEVTDMRLGSVQTIDLRLQNLIGNIEDLTDPDLYPNENDKKKIAIFERYSPGSVGAVMNKMWQRANGRDIQFKEEELPIVDDLSKYLADQDIEPTKENINKYLQIGFDSMKFPFAVRQSVKDSRAVEAIAELQQLLVPSDDVSRIFSKAGEDFRPNSGVMALGADLDYLENLVVKHEKGFTDDEKAAVNDYIDVIRAKMAELQGIYDNIVQNFNKYVNSVHGVEASQLQDEIDEISKIIRGTDSQTVITTTSTNSLTTIIENMRECLSAKTKGINNDTNLAFGEGYQFYVYSNAGSKAKGSNSDEIVYFVPSERGGERSLNFVMDLIYGRKNSDILACHVGVVLKKATRLKKQFPEVPIRIFIPRTTFTSCSMLPSVEDLSKRVDLPPDATIDRAAGVYNIPESGFSDHYIEFNTEGFENPRANGERVAYGIEIVL